MAKRKTKTDGLHVVDELEGFLNNATDSIENVGETVMQYIRKVLSGLKKHKKLVVLGVLAVLAYNYFLKLPEEDEEEE